MYNISTTYVPIHFISHIHMLMILKIIIYFQRSQSVEGQFDVFSYSFRWLHGKQLAARRTTHGSKNWPPYAYGQWPQTNCGVRGWPRKLFMKLWYIYSYLAIYVSMSWSSVPWIHLYGFVCGKFVIKRVAHRQISVYGTSYMK